MKANPFLKLIELIKKPTKKKTDIENAIRNLMAQGARTNKRMGPLSDKRSALLSRFESIKKLDICYRKKHTEISSLLYKYAGYSKDYFDDQSFYSDGLRLTELYNRLMESWAAQKDSDQLSNEQIEKQEELHDEIYTLVLKTSKVLTFREKLYIEMEVDNARIEKLMKDIGH